MDDQRTKARVVDLLRYRQERERRPREVGADPGAPRPALAAVNPFRPLTAREIAHRQGMLAFLGRTTGV